LASLPVMEVLPNTIYASDAFLPISLSEKDLLGNYVPFGAFSDANVIEIQ
jgi:hypothetical protein